MVQAKDLAYLLASRKSSRKGGWYYCGILKIPLKGKFGDSHIIDEETEAQRGSVL